jgi:hypothetical protein
VWTSAVSVPLQYVVIACTAAQSGSLVVRWTGTLPAPSPSSPAADVDATVARGQTASLHPGLATSGVISIADSQGGSFAANVSADQVPIDTAAVPPPATTAPQRLLYGAPAGSTFSVDVAVDSDIHALAIALRQSTNPAIFTSLTVTGKQSGLTYLSTPPAGPFASCEVLSAIDQAVTVAGTYQPGAFPVVNWLEVIGYQDDTLTIPTPTTPLPVAPPYPPLAGVFGGALAAGGTHTLVVAGLGARVQALRLLVQWAAAPASGLWVFFRPSGRLLYAAALDQVQPAVSLDLVGIDSDPSDGISMENLTATATGLINITAVHARHT